MSRAQIKTLHIRRSVYDAEANQRSGMYRLVHHAARTDARTTVADFHVENSLERMDNQTETKEI